MVSVSAAEGVAAKACGREVHEKSWRVSQKCSVIGCWVNANSVCGWCVYFICCHYMIFSAYMLTVVLFLDFCASLFDVSIFVMGLVNVTCTATFGFCLSGIFSMFSTCRTVQELNIASLGFLYVRCPSHCLTSSAKD